MPGSFVVTRDFLPPEQCDELIATCESCSFCKDPNPAYTQATLDIELDRQPLVAEKVKELGIIAKLTKAVKAFHRAVTCFNDVFVVKYDADQQRELERHTDGGDVSFMLALSSRDAYEGGGTEFDGEQGPLHLEQGSCVVFPASTYHRGIPITSGKRYLLVAFCYTSAAATRVPGNISLDVVPLHGNRNSFDLFDSENFLPSSIKASVKALAKLGKSCFIPAAAATDAHTTALEAFILSVFRFHTQRLNLKVQQGAGAEVWSQRLDVGAGDFIPWHRDKCEASHKSCPDAPLRHPTVSTVTYLTDSSVPTVVFGENNALVVFGRKGQHLAFDGKMLHSVLPRRSGKKRKRGPKENRLTLLINLWLDPPAQEGFVPLPPCAPQKNTRGADDVGFAKALWEEKEVRAPTLGAGSDDPDEIVESIRGLTRTSLLVKKNEERQRILT